MWAPNPRTNNNATSANTLRANSAKTRASIFGPEGALNLRAQNLTTFLQLAAGVDDKTWLHHLAEGAYSRWFAEAIKDQELAAEASSVEQEAGLSADDSRARIKELVDKRYTAPAKSE